MWWARALSEDSNLNKTMSKIGYSTLRISDIGWGIDTYRWDSEIDNNQGVSSVNYQVEGNKLNVIPGFTEFIWTVELPGAAWAVKGMGSYGDYLFVINSTRITVVKDGAYVSNLLDTFSSSNYDILSYFLGDLYLVITDKSGAEDVRFLKLTISTSGLAAVSPTGLSDKKFTSAGFYLSRVVLGGNPKYPGNIFSSVPASVSAPTLSYDFSWTGSSSRVVGDGNQVITGFSTRQWVFYVVTKTSVWKAWDTLSWYDYVLSKETNTWAVNQSVIQPVEQDLFYFDGFAVRRLSYEANTLALKDASISDSISNEILSLPRNQEAAVSSFSYPHYKLFLRSDTSSGNDTCFVYNVIRKSWTTQTNITASCSTSSFDWEPLTFLGSPYEPKVYVEEKRIRAFDWGTINASYVGKVHTLWDDSDFKRFSQLEIFGKIAPGLTLYVDLIVDGTVVQTREISKAATLSSTTGTETSGISTSWGGGTGNEPLEDFVYRYEMWSDGRGFQLWLRSNWYGNLEVNGFNLTYKFLKNYPVHY